jgi:uncharacterized protein
MDNAVKGYFQSLKNIIFAFSFIICMILPFLYIAPASSMGRGVFTSEDIEADTIVEIAPVIIMSREDRKLLDQTVLHDYIFEWGDKKDQCCMALGYVPIYNHAYRSNCEYEMDFEQEQISIRTVHFIKAGEELFINYNGNWNDDKRLWFDAK